jgi:hypothetical protein
MSTGPPEVHALPTQQREPCEDVWQRIRQDLTSILQILEGRLLYLIREGGRSAIPPDAVVSELSFLSRDLRAGFRRLMEVEERRDLGFSATKELRAINQHCTWLFRKIVSQQIFLRKLTLEATLRDLISTEAFAIYQTLLGLEEEEHEALSSDDAQVRARLMKE